MDSKIKTANVRYEGRLVIITGPYDAAFVSDIKASLKSRKWDSRKKSWTVDIRERPEALEVTGRYFQVVEENMPGAASRDAGAGADGLSDAPITTGWPERGGGEVWVDGACLGNPGPGGYGIVFRSGREKKSLSGGFRLTTNNRMEITAAIMALAAFDKGSRVVIHSDSRYVVDAIEKGWARRWRSNNWKRNKDELAVNPDLWERLLELCEERNVEFRWVRGHNAQAENECCDQMAREAAGRTDLPADEGYEGQDGKR